MKELNCLKINYNKLIIRTLLDFVIIFVLLYLITFIENIMYDFSNSFSYVFEQKRGLFLVMIGISFGFSILLAFIDVSSRCLAIKYDEDKIIFVKKKKQEGMKLGFGLNVKFETKDNCMVYSFRQDKRLVNVYLNKSDGLELLKYIKSKGIAVNNAAGKKVLSKGISSQEFYNETVEEKQENSIEKVQLENIDKTDEIIEK